MALRTVLLGVAALLALTGELHADDKLPAPVKDTIALLPLDADQQLEIYGQPVAMELARALGEGGFDVVVVGPKMAVPEHARLIVDGKIAGPPKGDKSTVVTLSIRIRTARDGLFVDGLESKADTLATIDRAAAELSARMLPVVRTQLAALAKAAVITKPHTHEPPPPRRTTPPAPAPKPWEIATSGSDPTLTAALAAEVPAWSRTVPGTKIELVVKNYTVERPGVVSLARARVHVRTWQGTRKTFDRVVVTDTVVGDRVMASGALVSRVAREVLAIAAPHVRRGAGGAR